MLSMNLVPLTANLLASAWLPYDKREAGKTTAPGRKIRLVVVLWRAGLRISEAPPWCILRVAGSQRTELA
jgi:hypothetical protein